MPTLVCFGNNIYLTLPLFSLTTLGTRYPSTGNLRWCYWKTSIDHGSCGCVSTRHYKHSSQDGGGLVSGVTCLRTWHYTCEGIASLGESLRMEIHNSAVWLAQSDRLNARDNARRNCNPPQNIPVYTILSDSCYLTKLYWKKLRNITVFLDARQPRFSFGFICFRLRWADQS